MILELRVSQRRLHDVLPLIDKAEKCGIDVTDLRAGHGHLSTRLQAFLEHFGNAGDNLEVPTD